MEAVGFEDLRRIRAPEFEPLSKILFWSGLHQETSLTAKNEGINFGWMGINLLASI